MPKSANAILDCDKEAILKNTIFYDVDCSQVSFVGNNSACYAITPLGGAEDTLITQSIDKYLSQNAPSDSPLLGLGTEFVSGAAAAGINPLLLVGIARYETVYGTEGVALDQTYNAFARTALPTQPGVIVDDIRWYQYGSFSTSLDGKGVEDDQAQYIKREYINGLGIDSVRDFVYSYAPDLSEADKQNYVQVLQTTIDSIVSGSSDPAAFGCTSSASDGSYDQNIAAGQQMAAGRGFINVEWTCLFNLWTRESGWHHLAINDAEGNNDLNGNKLLDPGEYISDTEHDAYGIPQSLPGGKMASVADDWRYNPITQIQWGLGYIEDRYNTPCGAWAHSETFGWY
jgi:hypothetical protein